MRIVRTSIIVALLAAIPIAAQDPPAPLPILPPTPRDSTALRAALQLPLDPPEYRFRFDHTGHYDVIDRSAEADRQIAEITAKLKHDPSDAERYDELRLWHRCRGDVHGVRDCAARAARWYRDRVRTDPYNAVLLSRCGEALIEVGELAEAERRLRKAVAADPDCWRAWLLLARIQIDSAYALLERPAPFLAEEPGPTVPPLGPIPRPLPAALRVDLPPTPDVEPVPQPVRPAGGIHLPTRVVAWAEVRQLSAEAASCLDEALAIAPHEPAVRFARCCQRKLAADAAEDAGSFDPFDAAENVADVRAAITAETTDPDLIAVATWFELVAAQKRLDRADDPVFRRQAYCQVCERIERLEAIAAQADGPAAARAALVAAHLCRKIGQPFRAGVQVRFAITADPASRPAWDAYMATLAESGSHAEYLTAARKAVERFDEPAFHLRLADALARTDETGEALAVIEQARRRDPENVPARLAEAALRLRMEGSAALPRVNELLDGVESALRTQPPLGGQVDCALLRACSQIIGGNATLGRMLLEDLDRREPRHPRVKVALAAITDE
jgi:tetratricopeptide (TPR) repeat protein